MEFNEDIFKLMELQIFSAASADHAKQKKLITNDQYELAMAFRYPHGNAAANSDYHILYPPEYIQEFNRRNKASKTMSKKEETIQAIKARILDEQRKHPTLDWAYLAASKIYDAHIPFLSPVIQTAPWQLCPRYMGEGQLPNSGATTSVFRVCNVCNGTKVIMPAILNPNPNG